MTDLLERLDFSALAKASFQFLARHGYQLTASADDKVQFVSAANYVYFYVDTRCCELSLWIGTQGAYRPYGIDEVMRLRGIPEGTDFPAVFALTKEEMARETSRLAMLLEKHGGRLLDGFNDDFAALEQQSQREAYAYTLAGAKRQGAMAWQRKDYRGVMRTLGRYSAAELTADEVKWVRESEAMLRAK